jgi:hypothetical protein
MRGQLTHSATEKGLANSKRNMGEITTLALNAPNKASLRTTIPMFIVKQWGLKPGDKLDWSLESMKNEIVIIVKDIYFYKKIG